MAYTVRQLITRAYYTSGIVSRSYQSLTGQQLTNGFELLNDLLAEEAITGDLIPHYKEYDFDAIIAQEKYFIPNLIDIESVTFNIDIVRYSMLERSRKAYFATARVDNISTLPFSWHAESVTGGMDLYLYFLPDDTYQIRVWGKFGLTEVTDPEEDLELTYDRFYLTYLRYALAEYICNEEPITFLPQAVEKLSVLKEKLLRRSPLDLTASKASTLTETRGLNWAEINLGRGWSPGG